MYIRMHKAFYNNSSITMKQAPKQSNKVATHQHINKYVHVLTSVLMIMADYQSFLWHVIYHTKFDHIIYLMHMQLKWKAIII